MSVLRTPVQPVLRSAVTGPLSAPFGSDPVLALFDGTTNGFYFRRDTSPYFQLSTGATPAANTDPVGYSGDLSPNGNHGTQATAAARPQLAANGLEFDATDDYLVIPPDAAGAASSSNTIVTVVRCDGAGSRYIFDGQNSDEGFLLLTANGVIRPAVVQTSGATVANGTTDIRDGNLHILSARYDRANQQLIGRVDGVTEVDEATADADKTAVGTALHFGSRGSVSAALLWDGLISDTMLIDTALSDTDLGMVEAEFAARYGITL